MIQSSRDTAVASHFSSRLQHVQYYARLSNYLAHALIDKYGLLLSVFAAAVTLVDITISCLSLLSFFSNLKD